MKDDQKYLHNRTAIAAYFGVTRQTLYRWEKILPMSGYQGSHQRMRGYEADEWHRKMLRKDHDLRQSGDYVRE